MTPQKPLGFHYNISKEKADICAISDLWGEPNASQTLQIGPWSVLDPSAASGTSRTRP